MDTIPVPKPDEETLILPKRGTGLTQENFTLVKNMLYRGEKFADIASELHIGEATIARIRKAKDLADYFRIAREAYTKYLPSYKNRAKNHTPARLILTSEDFATVKTLLAQGTPQKEIIEKTNRSHGTIFRISKAATYEAYLARSHELQQKYPKYPRKPVDASSPTVVPTTPAAAFSFTQELETLIEKEVRRRVQVRLDAIKDMI